MSRLSVVALWFALTALVGVSATAHAQADLPGVRAMGMGEAMRATATGAEAPMLNPAGMSLVKQYVIEAMYGFRVEDLGHHVNVSVVDSITSRVAAGLFYDFIYTQPKLTLDWAGGRIKSEQLTRTGHVAGLSLSMALGDHFSLGATVKYLHMATTAPLPKPTTPSSLNLDSINGITFDLGLIVRLGDKFNIAAIGYNLWDHGSKETPLSLGIGLAYVPLPVLSINFDTVVNFTGYKTLHVDADDKLKFDSRITARLGPGIEWTIARKVPVRLGVVYDSAWQGHTSRGATFLTMGLGYLSSSFGIDLGYRVKVEAGIENFLMLGLRLFVN